MTFAELQASLSKMKHKQAVLAKLVEIIDEDFMIDAEGKPKKVLLLEDKTKVPESAFDDVANDLNNWIKNLQAEEQKMLLSQVALTPPAEEAKIDPKSEAA